MRISSALSIVTATTVALSSSSLAANITINQPGVPFIPTRRLPAPHGGADPDEVVDAVFKLGRSTKWILKEKRQLEGELGEPEGMVVLSPDRILISSGMYIEPTVTFPNGSIINGTDRANGKGFAVLILFDGEGKRIASSTISKPGSPEYHPGGCDYDADYIYTCVAQYRPNSTSTVVQIDPRTLEATPILHAMDHNGGVVSDPKTNTFVTLNWGSRNASTFRRPHKPILNKFTTPLKVNQNTEYWVDYQDCKHVGHPRRYQGRGIMMCSGVTGLGPVNIGGIALVEEETMVSVYEVPLQIVSDQGTQITENPMDYDIHNGNLRLYFVPDQHNSSMYVYQPDPASPYEF